MKNIFLFIALALLYVNCLSQENQPMPAKYGIFADYNINMHTANFNRLPGIPNCCPRYETGSGNGISIGALYEIPFTKDYSIEIRFGYQSLNAQLTKEEPVGIIINNTIGAGAFTHYLDATLSNIGLQAMFAYHPIDNLNLYVGARIGFMTNASYTQVEKITSPSDQATFLDSTRTRNYHTGNIPNANSIQLFIPLGVSYNLPINKNQTLFIAPEAFYQLALSNVYKDSTWKTNSLQLGLALKYSPKNIETREEYKRIDKIDTIRQESPLVDIITYKMGLALTSKDITENGNIITTTESYSRTDTIVSPKTYEISLDAVAYGVDSLGNEIPNPKFIVEEFTSNRLDPLLNYVFFDENSSELPQRYRKLNSSNTNAFAIEKFYNDSTLGIYYDLLNIIGKRMTENKSASITIMGCNSNIDKEKNNLELSKSRALSVQKYLIDVWNIDASRLKIEAKNLPEKYSKPMDEADKIAENRRVEIYSNDYKINEPVFIENIERRSNPPIAIFKLSAKAEAGIKSWEFKAKQSDEQNFKAADNGNPPKQLSWELNKNQISIPKLKEPVKYSLAITDNKNNKKIGNIKEMQIDLMSIKTKRINKISDYELDKYSLILFDFDKSDLSGNNEKIVELIKTKIKPESIIEIKGYTDRTGTEEYNQALSERRAKATQNALKRADATSVGIGKKELIYDNNSPEGRFYCRTVQIIVKTPIK